MQGLRVLAFVSLSCILAACYVWPDAQVVETKRRGDIVRHALGRYRERSGKFPKTLQSLSPEYLQTIPQPTVGKREWVYETFVSDSAYLLSVAIRSDYEPELHAGTTGDWSYDTK
jgi:hypothetical protein